MKLARLKRRGDLVFAAVSAATCLAVFLFHDWFHAALLPALGLTPALGDMIGTIAILGATTGARHIVCRMLAEDAMRHDAENARFMIDLAQGARSVAADLRQAPELHGLVREKLSAIIAGESDLPASAAAHRHAHGALELLDWLDQRSQLLAQRLERLGASQSAPRKTLMHVFDNYVLAPQPDAAAAGNNSQLT